MPMLPNLRRTLAAGVPILACALVLVASPTAQDQQAGQAFRASAEAFFTDVRVLNARGQFVPDLRRDEFRVYEDDVEQTITVFQPWIGGRLRSEAVVMPPPEVTGLVLPGRRPPTDESGRIFIIFIDDLHLQSQDTPRVRHVLAQIRDTVIHEGDLVGLVSSGYSSIAVDLSYDYGHARFNESIGKVVGSAPSPAEIVQMPQTTSGPSGVQFNAHTAFSLAHDMLARAARITGRRKAFIYVSSGYDFSPYEDSRYQFEQERYGLRDPSTGRFRDDVTFVSPFEKQGQQFSDAELTAELAELTRMAVRSNVIFFPIDPRGLLAGPDINTTLTQSEWAEAARTSLDSLRLLGDETGGFCACNTNDFRGALERIDAEMSDYYMLGYNSTNPDPLQVRRRVRIEVTREGDYELVYRNEYTLDRSRSGGG